MPDEPTQSTQPEAPAAPAQDGTGTPAPTPSTEGQAPQWEGDFDPERAARLVANLRTDLEKAKADLVTAKTALGEKEEAEKSEAQRLQERAEQAERDLAEARTALLRSKVAKEHSIPDELVEFLTGSTEEEMKAKAEALGSFVKKPADDVPGKPKPALVPGNGAEPEAPFDPAAVAKAARSY